MIRDSIFSGTYCHLPSRIIILMHDDISHHLSSLPNRRLFLIAHGLQGFETLKAHLEKNDGSVSNSTEFRQLLFPTEFGSDLCLKIQNGRELQLKRQSICSTDDGQDHGVIFRKGLIIRRLAIDSNKSIKSIRSINDDALIHPHIDG